MRYCHGMTQFVTLQLDTFDKNRVPTGLFRQCSEIVLTIEMQSKFCMHIYFAPICVHRFSGHIYYNLMASTRPWFLVKQKPAATAPVKI